MIKETAIQIFEQKHVRSAWSEEEEKWYFSIVDVVELLTDQATHQDARNYWKVLKHRLVKEGNETVTNCNRLKLPAVDGKMRFTDVADVEHASSNLSAKSTYSWSVAFEVKNFERNRFKLVNNLALQQ